jgi:hypothetical protein
MERTNKLETVQIGQNPNDGECRWNVEGLQPIHAPGVMFLNFVNGKYAQQLRKCYHLENGNDKQTQGHILSRQQWLQLLKTEFEVDSEQSLLQTLPPQQLQQLLQELCFVMSDTLRVAN